jgi:acetylornithine/N-succinyldiaminopimelate aminotransferase
MSSLFKEASSAELIERARGCYTPNYRQSPIFPVRGEGARVWDRDGRAYLDLIAGIAVSSLGHGHPRLVQAIQEQAAALIHTSNLYFNEPALALMEQLVDKSFADRVFFTNSGAESNEAALKLARRYWREVRGRDDRSDYLTFHKSFHGRTFATVTATGQPKYHKGFEPMLPGFHYADYDDLEAVERALDAADDRVGAILIEPVQCEGGLRIPGPGYLTGLRKICDDRDVVLIFDEVQTGVGRTGQWFCYQIEGVEPDIMTLAKGLGGGVPLGAMLCTNKVAGGFEPGSHATTFGGNPLATRAGLAVMTVIEEDGLLDHVRAMGAHLQGALEGLVDKYPDRCIDARGHGLLRGLELRDDDGETGRRVVAACVDRGLLANAIGGRILRFAPPLVIQRAELDEAVQILDDVLGAL